jgi:hypothetical protein
MAVPARPNQREQGHSGYEGASPQIKDKAKSALIISNFYATSNLYLAIARRPEPFVHFYRWQQMPNRNNRATFDTDSTFWRGNYGTITVGFQKSAMI